jgi:hypothetical protein
VIATVLLGFCAGLAGCDADDATGSSGSDRLCADEVTFRGIDYTASGPTGGPPEDLPADPVRGSHIGRTQRCDDSRGVDGDGSHVERETVWLQAYQIQGLPPRDGIFVESFGPMAPIRPADATE